MVVCLWVIVVKFILISGVSYEFKVRKIKCFRRVGSEEEK